MREKKLGIRSSCFFFMSGQTVPTRGEHYLKVGLNQRNFQVFLTHKNI